MGGAGAMRRNDVSSVLSASASAGPARGQGGRGVTRSIIRYSSSVK